MLAKTEKHHYLELAEHHDTGNTELSEYRVNEALKRIEDTDLRLEIDSLIGELALEHEYKGFELGLKIRRRCGR